MLSDVLTCPDCDGRGMIAKGAARYECEGCFGTGAVYTPEPTETAPTKVAGGTSLKGDATCHLAESLSLATSDERPSSNGTAAKLHRLDVGRMVAETPPPVPWIIENLVVRGELTVLHGREGEGKSLFTMALAAGVALGETEGGFDCQQGGVLVLDAENGSYEIHRRVHALGLPAAVEVYEPGGSKRFDLRHDLDELDSLLTRHRPHLLVLDSFRSLWGGKENDSDTVAPVLDALRNLVRRHQTGTVLLHHSGRTTGEYRGSTAIGASAELGFKLGRADGDPDHDRRYVECWKCRPAPKPGRRWVRLTVDDGRVFIDEAEPPDDDHDTLAAPAGPVRSELAPQIIAALTAEPQTRASLARAVGRDPKDRSVGRILDALLAAGQAEKVGPDSRPQWKVAGGTSLKGDATCHLAEDGTVRPFPGTGSTPTNAILGDDGESA